MGIQANSILYTNKATVLILVYEYLPYMILCLYASMESIHDNIIHASLILGASKARTFANLVFPMSVPGLLSGILLVFVPVVGSFVEPGLVGGSSGMLVGSVINTQYKDNLNMGYGAMSFNETPYGMFPYVFTTKCYTTLFTLSNLPAATWLSLKFSVLVALTALVLSTLAAVRGEYFEFCGADAEGANPFHLQKKIFTGLSWKLIGLLGSQPVDISALGLSADHLEEGTTVYVRIRPENVVYYNH